MPGLRGGCPPPGKTLADATMNRTRSKHSAVDGQTLLEFWARRVGFPMMAIQGPFPFRPNPMTSPGLSQAGRSHYPNQGYSNYNNPSHVDHTSYHQPFGSAQQPMGNPRPTLFTSGLSQESISSPAVPPPTASIDPIMSALAQMMSKLT